MSEGAGSDLEGQQTGLSMVQVSLSNPGIQSVIQSASQQQSIIHATGHNSVIQTAGHGVPTIQVVRVAQVDEEEDPEVKRRREILSRRPSYRKILDDLSSPVSVTRLNEESLISNPLYYRKILNDLSSPVSMTKLDEDSNSSQSQDGDSQDTSGLALQYQNVVQGGIQLSVNQDHSTIGPGIQTLTMTNASPATTAAASAGATIVQYAQGPDGQQFYIPVGSTGTMQAYQIAAPGSLPQGVVMASQGNTAISSPQQLGEEAARKRELRLLKNRDAAKECRRKKKDYVKCLENRVAVLENQNKTLIEELKALKELYCQTDI